MWASFTSGTYPFLKQLAERHKKETFYFMRQANRTLAYYEHKRRRSIFVSGKTYQIIDRFGQLDKKGYVTMEHIPLTDDGVRIFEERVRQLFPILVKRTGVVAMRFLKQRKKHEYVLLTLWEKKRYKELWESSPFYKEENIQQFAQLSAYFLERPFTNDYYMVDEEDEEDLDSTW